MNKVNNLLKNIFALFLGVIFVLFIIEGVLRIYNPFDFRVKGDKIVLSANKRYVIKTDKLRDTSRKSNKFDETIIHTKNSIGFRGEDPPADFEEYLTIITVGGSTTECTFLSDGKTWTDILGKKLKYAFENVWINNAGFDGHSTYGHFILMEDYIVKFRPDIVLFLVGANDQERERFGEYDLAIMKNRVSFSSPKQFLVSMANHSEIFSLGLNFYRYWKAFRLGVEHVELNFRNYKKTSLKYFSEDRGNKQSEALELYKSRYLKSYLSRLKKLIKISKENRIDPVLLTQPALYGDFIDDVTGVDLSFTKFNWELLELYNDITRGVGAEENILVVDLAREMPKNTKYYYDWFHFTNEGAEKVAEIIYNNLLPYLEVNYKKHIVQ